MSITNYLTDMDYVRSALANAKHSNMTLDDVLEASSNAKTVQEFDHNVNLLGLATPPYLHGTEL